ncbi:TetR/AcrR family transcriptional regulator [Devosia aquimaris]|uniref:TetR/AcrR family transcriptional regulator n=1 Tax=Devosia aquimaris TaxID=2866214 RepID=UPI001CD046FC|nr:TetR/AcrR family transcriptional regulator [Devosia sp. CJK-A8-3]
MKRKIPRQQRAISAVDITLEATAQLLEQSLDGHVTTNHVAARAGYSVGTIYRYFADKNAIFEAMIRSELARQEAQVAARLADPDITTVEGFARVLVTAALKPLKGRVKVRRALMLAAANRRDLALLLDDTLDRLTELFVEAVRNRAADCVRVPPEAGRHVILRGVIAATRSAALAKPHLLDDPDFEIELVRSLTQAFR